jgi:hypothetical protein
MLINLSKVQGKEKILKSAGEKQQVTYKGIPIGLKVVFSEETLQVKREWDAIFKTLEEKKNPVQNEY